jgi:hypothetical protein
VNSFVDVCRLEFPRGSQLPHFSRISERLFLKLLNVTKSPVFQLNMSICSGCFPPLNSMQILYGFNPCLYFNRNVNSQFRKGERSQLPVIYVRERIELWLCEKLEVQLQTGLVKTQRSKTLQTSPIFPTSFQDAKEPKSHLPIRYAWGLRAIRC